MTRDVIEIGQVSVEKGYRLDAILIRSRREPRKMGGYRQLEVSYTMSLRTFWPALMVVPWGVAAVSLLQNNRAFTTSGLLCMGVFGLLFLVMALIRIICRRRQIKLESTIEVSDSNVATRLLGALGTLEYLLLKLDASEHYRLRTMLWDVIDSISLTSTDVEVTLGQFEDNLRSILMSRHISLR